MRFVSGLSARTLLLSVHFVPSMMPVMTLAMTDVVKQALTAGLRSRP
jgi:hypothetical protein